MASRGSWAVMVVNNKQNQIFINTIKTKIAKDPTTAMNQIAVALKANSKMLRMVVDYNLGLKLYIRVESYSLADSMKAKRLERH